MESDDQRAIVLASSGKKGGGKRRWIPWCGNRVSWTAYTLSWNSVEYRAAISDAEKERIYRMRYAAYLKEGALLPGAPVIFKDRYDDLANGVTIGVYVKGRASEFDANSCSQHGQS